MMISIFMFFKCGKAFATVHKLKIHLQHNHHPRVIPCPGKRLENSKELFFKTICEVYI